MNCKYAVRLLLLLAAYCFLHSATAAEAAKYIVVRPSTQCPGNSEWNAVVEKEGGRWKLKEISRVRRSRSSDQQEVLCIDLTTNTVPTITVDYREIATVTSIGLFECSFITKIKDYSPCNSQFTSTSILATAGKNILAGLLTLGLASGTNKTLDTKEIGRAIEESDLLAAVAPAAYRYAFESAKTISDFEVFIAAFTSADPDNLIPKAQQSVDQLRMALVEKQQNDAQVAAQRQLEAQRLQEQLAQQRQQQQIEAENQQRAAQRRETKRVELAVKTVNAFRSKLAVEAQTNCGPVIEIKGNLLKIYFPVANYGNEHWIQRTDLFPVGYPCMFLNGNYRAPEY